MSSPLRISIAKANLATATRLAALGSQTFSETFAADNTPEDMATFLAQTYGPEIQLGELQQARYTFLLAEMQGELVGFAKLWRDSTLGLAADEPAHLAKAENCTAIVLGVWERNERAKAFYQRLGFREIGEVAFKLGEDVQRDLIMRKGLAGRA
jgi:GNAT superfamily N-acetyltransferase